MVIKPQPPARCSYTTNGNESHALCFASPGLPFSSKTRWIPPTPRSKDHRLPCPYGCLGDRLWVREAWQAYEPQPRKFGGEGAIAHCTMRVHAYPPIEGESVVEYRADTEKEVGWRSSHLLPRWASRILLEITEIRVERIQDIAKKDIMAEGFGLGYDIRRYEVKNFVPGGGSSYGSIERWFMNDWNKHNARKGFCWNENPWVWVVKFKILEAKR